MVAHIRCIVLEVPASSDPRVLSDSLVFDSTGFDPIEHRLRRPVRELLPWADPYIARLIRNLQDEVREERAASAARPLARPRGASRSAAKSRRRQAARRSNSNCPRTRSGPCCANTE